MNDRFVDSPADTTELIGLRMLHWTARELLGELDATGEISEQAIFGLRLLLVQTTEARGKYVS